MHAEISIVIPVKDEEENVQTLANEINRAMSRLAAPWECVWVDDGSTDGTAEKLQELQNTDPRHRFVALSKNYGQSAALFAGFRSARGTIIATLDGDGQNDPADIPILIDIFQNNNVDMVNGVRRKRHDSFVRKISSRIANSFRDWVTGDKVTDVGCSVRVFRAKCVEHIPLFKGMHRFFPTLVKIAGFTRIMEHPVNHRPRSKGVTKYGIQNRLWVGLADLGAVKWMQRRLVFPEVKTSTTTTQRGKEEK